MPADGIDAPRVGYRNRYGGRPGKLLIYLERVKGIEPSS